MPTDASFRFSTYLTLALACVALGYAVSQLLLEVAVFAVLAVIGLGVLYFLESRVSFLSIPAANRMGIAITIVYLMWVAYRIKREIDTGELINIGWHMLIVALCGPLLMLVIVAKVARSDKHAGDYWTLHGVALVGIGLSAAFAEEALLFALFGFYLVAAVWSLTLLHLSRASGAVPPIPGGRLPASKTIAVSADPTGHRTDLRPAVFWAAFALLVAVPLYLLTPRSDAPKAHFGTPRIETGFAADQMVDLNQIGPLKSNSETAFEFTATYPDGTPKTDLNPNQRWRSDRRPLRFYANGEWKPGEGGLPPITFPTPGWKRGDEAALARHTDVWTPPKLGPGQFTLSFDVPAQLRSSFLADPVIWVPGEPPPVAAMTDRGLHGWLPVPDGTFYWDPNTRVRGTPRRYVQEYRTRDDPDVSPPFRFVENLRGLDNVNVALTPLRHNPVPRVKEYADAVLKELQRKGGLPPDKELRSERTDLPEPRYHDKIARAFSNHLATTPTLTYSTELRRENKNVDPIEDFLFHSKAGHCERFATALVLMLRSQGIPAVFVLGFKGCEHQGEGKYIVRQEHAHAWVEALVPKPDEPENSRIYQWLSLDPTTSGVDDPAQGGTWWRDANNWVGSRFEKYLTNYTADARRKALGSFVARIARVETLAGIAVGLLLAVGAWFAIRRYVHRAEDAAAHSDPMRWFGDLVAVLAAQGIVPAPGDTPMEFAKAAAAELRHRGCSEVAEVPLAWAEAYYQDRFGGMPPSDARLAELEAELDALRRALEK